MKRIIFILFISLFFTSSSFSDSFIIKFLDSNTGFYVWGNKIFKTSNAGESWNEFSQIVGLSGYYCIDLEIKNSLTLYCSFRGDNVFTYNYQKVFKSTNGGADWFQTFTHSSAGIENGTIDFLNENRGFYSADLGQVFRSTDGGQNWQFFGSGIPGQTYDIKFINQNTGFMCGSEYTIIKTTNSGENWVEKHRQQGGERFVYINFFNESTGIVFGGQRIAHTTDGGESWILSNSSFNSLSFYNGIGYAKLNISSSKFYIYRTINEGNNWNLIDSVGVPNTGRIYTADSNTVFLVTNTGFIKRFYGKSVSIQNISQTAASYRLYQNYPNPFNPTTKIAFDLPKRDFVSLKLYDVTGKEVKTLLNEDMNTGKYEYEFNASNLNSGIYFYTIVTSTFKETKKMILVK